MPCRLLALAACLASLAACSQGPSGQCTGTLGGQSFTATLDAQSEIRTVQRQVCTESKNKSRWAFSYGQGALKIEALSEETLNGLSEQELLLPPAYGARFETWNVTSPAGATVAPDGKVILSKGINLGAVFGTLKMGLTDGSQVECTFHLPKGQDEGRKVCFDDDDDDWD